MKKLIILLILTMFLAVSCGGDTNPCDPNPCEGNPCKYEEHAIDGSCSLFDTPTAYECDCEEGYHWAYFDCEKDSEEN